AAQLQVLMERELSWATDAAYLLGGATLNQLAADAWSYLQRAGTHQRPARVAVSHSRRSRASRLSFEQERLWLLDQATAAEALYNLTAAIRIDGPLSVPALIGSFNQIVQRHETLRTGFTQRRGKPTLVVAPRLRVDIPVVDVTWLESRIHAAVSDLVSEESRVAFRLDAPPLIRA